MTGYLLSPTAPRLRLKLVYPYAQPKDSRDKRRHVSNSVEPLESICAEKFIVGSRIPGQEQARQSPYPGRTNLSPSAQGSTF